MTHFASRGRALRCKTGQGMRLEKDASGPTEALSERSLQGQVESVKQASELCHDHCIGGPCIVKMIDNDLSEY